MRGTPTPVAAAQRAPALQALPQQIWPLAPQALQVPVPPSPAPLHTPPVWQMLPAQQAPPTVPQFMQVRAMPPPGLAQPRPLLQLTAPAPIPPAWQQAAPLLPHAVHIEAVPPSPGVPGVQRAPGAVQVFPPPPPQQISPSAPQAVPAAF
jgi:hypothetical protein